MLSRVMAGLSSIFVYSPELEQYRYPGGSPFNSQRAGLTRQKVDSMGLLAGEGRREVAPERLTRQVLETFHRPEYLNAIREAEAGGLSVAGLAMGLGTGDILMNLDADNFIKNKFLEKVKWLIA